jgi:catechol 2,3-dioxygenase-like lactoylglutathione lyase family enzyme
MRDVLADPLPTPWVAGPPIRTAEGVNGLGMLRFDHVGVVVDDLDAVAAFFLALGFEREGGALVEDEAVDKIIGLDGVRAELVMVRTPDGSGKLELVKYHAPADNEGAHPSPANRTGFRHIAIEVDGLDTIVDGLRESGFDTVGETREFGDTYRLCYVRGPEGLIVELAERIAPEAVSSSR